MDVTSTGYIKIKNVFVSKDIIKMVKRLCFLHFSQNGRKYLQIISDKRLICTKYKELL